MLQIHVEENAMDQETANTMTGALKYKNVAVRDVMTPLSDMTVVPIDIPEEDLENVLLEEGHNRIPVYKDSREYIVGILYVRDLLYLFKNSTLIKLEDLMSVPFFVPPHYKVAALLIEFQRRKVQIAIVRDERTNQAVGLVTLEDLIEEIVGEIEEIDTTLPK